MLNFFKKFLGSKSERDIKAIMPIVNQIHVAYEEIQKLSNDELRAKTKEFKTRIASYIAEEESKIAELKARIENEIDMDVEEKAEIYKQIDALSKLSYQKSQKILDDILPEAFAVMKDTARRFYENEQVIVTATQMDRDLAAHHENIRIEGDKAIYNKQWMAGGNMITWDMVHYDVQLIGGIVLHQGKIAEMATGEGKTLVATLPVYLNALTGKGVHVVTVNDYLAKRDSEWMGVLFQFHGLKVDCIDKHEPNSEARRLAYLADVTYGTNNEFGFDYLRDNMTSSPDELVQREHIYSIVDEVDSVLIDDARTPLIISGPTPKGEDQLFDELKPPVSRLYNLQRTLVTKILNEAKTLLSGNPTPDQEKKGGELLLRAYRGLPKHGPLIKFLSEPGMKTLLQKTENFYLQEQAKNMHLIDDELYFVIDEKNNTIDLTEKGIDALTESYQDPEFYLLPDVGSVIAEIEKMNIPESEKEERKSELMRDYAIKSERVHTVNQLLRAYALFEKDVEYVIIDNKVKIVDEQTGRILEGRRYSDGLHQAIEAKENVKVEAATQTYATITLQNYFRMYKKLAGMTGTAETEAGEFWDIYKLDVVVIPTNKPVIRTDREDMVYKTKREKYNSVIEEIENLIKIGRPVLVGTTSVETSELLSRMLSLRKIKHNVLNAKQHAREAEIVAHAGLAGMITIATNMAGRGTDIKLGPGVKEAGGLAIIGTERHESRRVDRQLRGRAGRQGDPGTSQFFVSLEDDLMRLFGSERIARIMDRLGIQEGEVIQHPMITRSIERAQRKVEENNFGIRKRLLEYDDVMNAQREVIYSRRRNALHGERLSLDIRNMMEDVCEHLIEEYTDTRDYQGFRMELLRIFGMDSPVNEDEFHSKSEKELHTLLFEYTYRRYKQRIQALAEKTYPVIKDVFENHSQFEYIAVPLTDGRKQINLIVNLKKAYQDKSREVVLTMEKTITLAVIDNAWKEHLREMDDLKQSVQNAVYEQKDPLLIYKFESFELFSKMLLRINKEITSFLMKASIPGAETQVKEASLPKHTDRSRLKEQREDLLSQASPTQTSTKPAPVKVEKRVGRNDPCPCGSGKKYKNCHGRIEN
ncbi:MAG TPA: preprotein translocase subunit SecA [Bacteroidales bacterium]|jgi:preprotein translocase subunit SecA|nr:preprotein translocase subunit SecA [Bacteroidales bacterium]MDI9573878.1 preprotein translocase subunit SecA [Bacteroidota bacterium]OQC59894.1 MAG: preprotein translocase subunit SecA [Bacteroidetes bacterium ADurb.Bin012]MBP9511650.1 preprotein translocase subunit SecA [Bacteroidales bacterium]MBP9587972.1 preprotein translocase subunit SecA [Bacteroidales bacterium]